MFGVMASNIHWHWTGNVYAAGFVAYLAALAATELVNWLAQAQSRA